MQLEIKKKRKGGLNRKADRAKRVVGASCIICRQEFWAITSKHVKSAIGIHRNAKHQIQAEFLHGRPRIKAPQGTLLEHLRNAKHTDMNGVLFLWSSTALRKRMAS